MTIEIADRLIKLRKKYGYSQEELADKLGLSRQAVSKWERAEASPDTDNLICLAKLYGVSLDELLATDEDVDTIVEEQVKKDETIFEDKGDRVEIGKDGVVISDDEGSKVIIKDKHITCVDEKGCVVRKRPILDKFTKVLNVVEGVLGLLALVAYILLGSLLGLWYNMWILIFVPEIICSIIRAIHSRNASKFNMVFTAIFTFFFVCMVFPGTEANLWHPMWVVFLTIPIYYSIVSAIRRALSKDGEIKDEE